jgi:hypothetical protein
MLLDEVLVGLIGVTGGGWGVIGGKFWAFFDWIDGPVSSCTLKVHV